MLIADDARNTVWRVAAADGSVTPQPFPTERAAQQPAAGTEPITTPGRSQAGSAPAAPAGQDGAPPAMGEAREPSQTHIAPAVGPEDGAPLPQPAE